MKRTSRRLLAALFVTLLAAIVAGCGGSSPNTAIVVEVPEGDAVQIRAMLSFTGASGLAGPLNNAIELAVQDFHRVHGYEIELGEPLDSMCSADGGYDAAQKVISNEQILGVIGTSCSVAGTSASRVLGAAGLSMISPSNTSPTLTSDLAGRAGSNHSEGYFRTSNNDLFQGKAVADFAYNERGLRRMAVVHDGDPYTSALAMAFRDAFQAEGGHVTLEVIEKDQRDMSLALRHIAEADPDGVFLPIFRGEGAAFAQQAREYDGLEDITIIGGAALLVAEFLEAPESEGFYFTGPEADFSGNVNSITGKEASQTLAVYKATYGEAPGSPYWAHAYDATTLLLAAIQRAAIKEEGNFFTRSVGLASKKLSIDRATLRRDIPEVSQDFSGLIGRTSCDTFGDCGTGRLNIYQHTDTSVTDPAQLPVVYHFEP